MVNTRNKVKREIKTVLYRHFNTQNAEVKYLPIAKTLRVQAPLGHIGYKGFE